LANGETPAVILGLAVGVAFMVLLVIVIAYTPTSESVLQPPGLVIQFDDTMSSFPDFEKAKVYIFPRVNNMTIDDLDWELGVMTGVQFAYGTDSSFGASRLGIYHMNGTIVVPNSTEFYISPELRKSDGTRVTVKDIDEQQRFGNGVQTEDLMLQANGVGQTLELVPAITFVVADSDIEDVDSNLDMIQDSIENPKLVKITIPGGASLADSGKSYEPQIVRVIVGYNNTVRWVNYDSTYHYIEADNDTDLKFYRETTYANPEASRRNLMDTGDSFLYTFTTPGEIGYHGKPHLRGTVIVEPFR